LIYIFFIHIFALFLVGGNWQQGGGGGGGHPKQRRGQK
jgi:hypothetical protein